jgi:hypothetical protein
MHRIEFCLKSIRETSGSLPFKIVGELYCCHNLILSVCLYIVIQMNKYPQISLYVLFTLYIQGIYIYKTCIYIHVYTVFEIRLSNLLARKLQN